MWLGMAGGRPHRFLHNNFSSVYRIFTNLATWFPCGRRRTLFILGSLALTLFALASASGFDSYSWTTFQPSWEEYGRDARCWWYFTLHIINVEKNVSRLPFHFLLLPYLCLHILGLVRVEVGWVCFDVLFFISEFHFLFLLIFILFSLGCLYMCC